MPDYAEVAGCSSFKTGNSPTYDSFGAYATTTLVGRQYSKNSYSAPNSVHYNNFINGAGGGGTLGNGNHHLQYSHNGNGVLPMSNNQLKMNIIENKMEQLMNNLNSPSAVSAAHQQQQPMTAKNGSPAMSKSVPQTPLLSTMRRNRLNNSINGKSNKLSSYGDKINFGEDGRTSEQPLFMKSKFDGSWQSIPSTSALTSSTTTTSNNNSPSHLPYHASPRHHPMQSSLNQLGDGNNQPKTNSHSYLSSFGKSDKV
jgi:hypothetical protein